jgi:hypothetical protein
MRALKTRWTVAVVAMVTAVALVVGPMSAPAVTSKVLRSKVLKVRPSGRTAKISAVKRGSSVYIVLYVKRNGRYVRLDSDRAGRFPAGAKVRPIKADQQGAAYTRNGGQGLLSWDGPDGVENSSDDFAKYFGWNIQKKSIDFF